MTEQDLPQVLAIEQQVYAFPWSEGILADCLKNGYFCWVQERQQALAGYCIVSTVLDEAHLLNIVTAPECQGQGLAREMLHHAMDCVIGGGATTMFLEVRRSNQKAAGFYESMGFVQVGERKGYYPAEGGREDAILMAVDLSVL